jgi:outer membrane protein W
MKYTRIFLTIFIILFVMPLLLKADKFRLGGSLHYYHIHDSLYSGMYKNGNLMWGLSMGYSITKNLELKLEGNYYHSNGKMSLSEEDISISLVPVILGARYKIGSFKNLNPYLGLGLEYLFLKETVPSRLDNYSDSSLGYHAEAGAYIWISKSLQVDFNIRYLVVEITSFDESLNLGGLRVGIGLVFLLF